MPPGRARTFSPPNPGSEEAVANGCSCPVLDNGHGKGNGRMIGERAVFWISGDCPMHARAPEVDE